MSSLRQELAAILMDYTDDIPEQTYIDILNKLAAIPAHNDPRSAKELQIELEKETDARENADQLNELLGEQLAEAENYINETQVVLFAIMGKNGPIYEDEDTVMYAKKPKNEVPHWWKSHMLETRIRDISMESPSIYTDYIDLHFEREETDEERVGDMADHVEELVLPASRWGAITWRGMAQHRQASSSFPIIQERDFTWRRIHPVHVELLVGAPDAPWKWRHTARDARDWRHHTDTKSSFREHVYQSCELHNNGRGAFDLDWWAYTAKYEEADYDIIVQDRRYRWVPRHLKIEFRYQNYKNSLMLNHQMPSIDTYHHIKCPVLMSTIISSNAQH